MQRYLGCLNCGQKKSSACDLRFKHPLHTTDKTVTIGWHGMDNPFREDERAISSVQTNSLLAQICNVWGGLADLASQANVYLISRCQTATIMTG